jgi:hypothetical protein
MFGIHDLQANHPSVNAEQTKVSFSGADSAKDAETRV